MSDEIFHLRPASPNVSQVPLLVSCPHAGSEFPQHDLPRIQDRQLQHPEDTDWFLQKLYEFVPDLGGSLLWARYSRYLIDLNRAPDSQALYQDGRLQTGLLPLQTFKGEALYPDRAPDAAEIQRRLLRYYQPYHLQIQTLLAEKLRNFGYVILVEGHSIRRHVPRLSPDPFPDLMLGNDLGKTMPTDWLQETAKLAQEQGFSVALNEPFRGGFITRSFARPQQAQFTMQIEMSQDLYMNEETTQLDVQKMRRMQSTLQSMILSLVKRAQHAAKP